MQTRINRDDVYSVFRQLCREAGVVCYDALNPDDRPQAGTWRLKCVVRQYIIVEIDADGKESYPLDVYHRPAREMYNTIHFAIDVLRSVGFITMKQELEGLLDSITEGEDQL